MKARGWVLTGGWISGACLILALGGLFWSRYSQDPNRGLPYRDSFTTADSAGWKAFGGNWEHTHGMVRNDSDERGAKLMTGSPYWRNYSVEADVTLLDRNGDAGLIIRSSDEDQGINAYRGYYAGVRTADDALVLGRADNDWTEVEKRSRMPGGIRPFQSYHLKLFAYDCHIIASLSLPQAQQATLLAINDSDCITSGRIGLRSYSSGGIWRNVVALPASPLQLQALIQKIDEQKDSASNPALLGGLSSQTADTSLYQDKLEPSSEADVQSISNLRLLSLAKTSRATIRGVVILTSPQLFVQDSTGGVSISEPNGPPLKVGDEVEVTGDVQPGDFSSKMARAAVRVLWTQSPVPPVSVTAFQASTGRYESTYIELRSRLAAQERGPGNELILDLDEGGQSYRAILNPDTAPTSAIRYGPESTLRLRGVCVLDPEFTQNLAPFALLVKSNSDVEVLSGPPWWNTRHILAIGLLVLLFSCLAALAHHRLQNWRFRAVLEERGRMAHEVHDTLAQSFAGIGFQLQAIRSRLTQESDVILRQLDQASDLVRHSHEEARRSIMMLRADSPESEDILSALAASTRRMVDGGPIKVTYDRIGDFRPMPLPVADTLFRIGQEAVANCIRHARATELTIRLTYNTAFAHLRVEDNGIGFQNDKFSRGFGLRGMRTRAESISAIFKVESVVGAGTRVEVIAPLPPRATITSWPKLVWKFAKEHGADARSPRQADTHTHR